MSKEAEPTVMWALSPRECTNTRESEVTERKLCVGRGRGDDATEGDVC